METLFINIIGCIAAYMVANSRNRSALWFLLGWIGFVIVLALPSLKKDPEAPTPETHVRCPDCKELVRHDARKCKHCGSALVPTDKPEPIISYDGKSVLEVAVAMKEVARDGDVKKMTALLQHNPSTQAVKDAQQLADLYRREEIIALLDKYTEENLAAKKL